MGRGQAGRFRTIAAFATLVVLVAGCSWGQYGHDASRAGFSPAEQVLSPANVASLAPLWRAPTGSSYGAQIADGSLFSISAPAGDAKLLAFAANGSQGCSGSPRVCTPQWSAPLSTRMTGIDALNGAYAIDGDRVYVVGYVPAFAGPWRLQVFDAHGKLGCSGNPTTCAPLWTASWGSGSADGGATLAVDGGRVYVSTPSGPDAVTVFDAAGVDGCTTGTTVTCSPRFATAAPSGGGPIAISGGHLIEGESFGLQVFDAAGVTGCTNQVCSRLLAIQHLGFPSISASTVYASGGAFALTPTTTCPALGCDPTWQVMLDGPPIAVPPAIAAGRMFVTEDVTANPIGIDVFDATGAQSCTGSPRTCAPVARLLTGSAPQGVAATASLAFVTTAETGNGQHAAIEAFDLAGAAGCSGAPAACQPLRSILLPLPVGIPAPPAVTNGLVAVSGQDGGIDVFALAG